VMAIRNSESPSLPHSIQNELSFRMRPDLSGRNEESPGRNRIK
jgi:hypothetical protein